MGDMGKNKEDVESGQERGKGEKQPFMENIDAFDT